MKDIIKIVKTLEGSSLLPEGVSETIQNEAKKQRGGFLSMVLGTIGASLLRNISAGWGINRAGEGIIRAGHVNKKGSKNKKKENRLRKQNGILMPLHPLTNFEIKKTINMKIRLRVFILEIIYQK